MKKTIVYVIVLLIIVIGAWSIFGGDNSVAVPEGGELGPATQTKAAGEVIAVDLEQAMVDGPYVVTVREENGSEAIIAVPSMGIQLCEAKDSILDVYELKPGDRVEVNGTLTADGSIVPCESPDHYFRMAAAE